MMYILYDYIYIQFPVVYIIFITSLFIFYHMINVSASFEASDHRVEEILTALRAVASAQEKSKHTT